ncbi:uncharacterized protein LOC141588006 [Silene latifolia]|uniref:uncharacterized protein LOC141588006 n=1 Tax=Silene latifolia TaxID=37657 RepID=UPI003D77D748
MVFNTKKNVYRLEAWCFDHVECSGLVKENWEINEKGDAPHILLSKLRRINNAFRVWACNKKDKWGLNWVKGHSGANTILGIRKETNEWTFDLKEIGGLFYKHFASIFNSEAEPECFEDYFHKYGYLFENPKCKVGVEDSAKLGRVHSKNEVRQAVSQLGPLKSPGPDGIPAAFYQKYWSIVKEDVINGALYTLNSGNVHKEFNKTFIVLIPKNDCPERVGDFRPISLCNVIMKVVTKCIANRLKAVMDDLVSPFQSAFIPNRSIADNIVIAQELLHVINHKSKLLPHDGQEMLAEYTFASRHDLGNYLGLPTCIGPSKRDLFKFLADQTKRRLSSWNNIFLSAAGKLTLIRSVLFSLSLFSLSVFRILVSVTSKLHSLMVHFWWSGTRTNKSIHLCSKDFLSKPVGEGSLGFRNIGCFNQALVAKSAWRILSVPGSLISDVIGPKLGHQDDTLFQKRWKAPQASSWALKSLV